MKNFCRICGYEVPTAGTFLYYYKNDCPICKGDYDYNSRKRWQVYADTHTLADSAKAYWEAEGFMPCLPEDMERVFEEFIN